MAAKEDGLSQFSAEEAGFYRGTRGAALVEQIDWGQELDGLDFSSGRWGAAIALRGRSAELERLEEFELAQIFNAVSAAISLHMQVGTRQLFSPALQMSDRRSAALGDFGRSDLAVLDLVSRRVASPWLRARLSDVVCTLSPAFRIPAGEQGAFSARSYLEVAKDSSLAHVVERREALQRALALARPYLRKDEEFHRDVWVAAYELLEEGLRERWIGVVFPLADEFADRNSSEARRVGELLEKYSDQWSLAGPDTINADTYRKAAKLFRVANDAERSRTCYHKSAEAYFALARGPGSAMLRADWMAEGIAVLRRNHGDRVRIRELLNELADIRLKIIGEMHSLGEPIDVTEIVRHVERRMTATDLPDFLLQLAFGLSDWSHETEVRSRVIKNGEQYVFMHMFRQVSYSEDGVPTSVTEPLDIANPVELEKRMVREVAQFDHPFLARVFVRRALDIMQERFEPTLFDFMRILDESPVVPRGHEWSLARGLLAGIDQDWCEAAVFLIPQVEPFIRAGFKRQGVPTLVRDEEGVEHEKSLSELLGHPDVATVLHPDIVLELKSLLTHRAGHNLRNAYAHGLLRDEELANVATVCLWWTMLRLILWPYRERAAEILDNGANGTSAENELSGDGG